MYVPPFYAPLGTVALCVFAKTVRPCATGMATMAIGYYGYEYVATIARLCSKWYHVLSVLCVFAISKVSGICREAERFWRCIYHSDWMKCHCTSSFSSISVINTYICMSYRYWMVLVWVLKVLQFLRLRRLLWYRIQCSVRRHLARNSVITASCL